METKYAVSQWTDDEHGCANGSEDRREFGKADMED